MIHVLEFERRGDIKLSSRLLESLEDKARVGVRLAIEPNVVVAEQLSRSREFGPISQCLRVQAARTLRKNRNHGLADTFLPQIQV